MIETPQLAVETVTEKTNPILGKGDGDLEAYSVSQESLSRGEQLNFIDGALRDYQQRAVDKLRDLIRAKRLRPVLMAPTGAGKTVIAAEVIRLARGRGKRVAFVVPALSLVDQAVDMLTESGVEDIGVIQANHELTDWDKPVQVCSLQTLQRRPFPKVDGVIVDECHLRFKFLDRWMSHPDWKDKPFIGLSATPWSKGLGTIFGDLITVASTRQLIDSGYLTPFRVFAPFHPDLSDVKVVAGDYHEGQLATKMNKGHLVADVVSTWQKQAVGRSTFIFAVDCAHAKALQEKFNAAGVACGYMDAFTSRTERQKIREAFDAGELKAVANVGVLTLGVDWDVRCIVVCRPTRSEILHTQIIGRGLRTAPGKTDLLVLDHSDNHIRLGLVTDIMHATLDSGLASSRKEPKRERLPKECPHCHALRPVGVAVCPECGFKPQVVSLVKYDAGQLFEVKYRGGRCQSNSRVVKLGKAGEVVELCDFYQQLVAFAAAHKYKRGWAAHKYKEAVGTWPPYAWESYAGVQVTPPVARWVRSRQIAYAKATASR